MLLLTLAQLLAGCTPRASPPRATDAAADAAAVAAAEVPADYTEAIELLRTRLPTTLEQTRVPGLAMAMVDGGAVVWAGGFGHAGDVQRTPVTAHTLFGVQSISKSYTALAVLRAVETGVLGLEDRVIDRLPGVRARSRFGPREVEAITLRRLLSHWASLPHEAPLPTGCAKRAHTFEEHVEDISGVWLIAPVGSRYRYSNLGYDLAGAVLQRNYAMPFAEVARRLVLEPLGMGTSTFDPMAARAAPAVASGHRAGALLPHELTATMPSGSLYASASEMARFVSSQLTGRTPDGERLISDELRAEMRRAQFPVQHQAGGYGLGLATEPWHGATLVFHDGSGDGYGATHRWMPEYGVGVVVLTNSEGSSLAAAVANRALELMVRAKLGSWPETTPLDLTHRPVAALAPAELRRFEGTYKPTGRLVAFGVSGEQLFFVDGEERIALEPRGAATFVAGERRFDFGFTERGEPAGVHVLERSGVGSMPINDYPGEPPGSDREEWRSYVGRYRGGDGDEVEVFRRNGHLYVSAEGDVKLAEHGGALFFTSEGETVRFEPACMVIAGTPYERVR